MPKKKPRKKKVFKPDPRTSGSAGLVGDRVIIQNTKKGPWFEAKVTATHLTGPFACAQIRVKYEVSKKLRELWPYDTGITARGMPRIIIFPPEAEIPKELVAYAKKHDLHVARKIVNADRPIYRLVTVFLRQEVYLRQTDVSAAEFSYEKARGWCNGKWETLDSEIDAVVTPYGREFTMAVPENMELDF